jgi:hypothetical protein
MSNSGDDIIIDGTWAGYLACSDHGTGFNMNGTGTIGGSLFIHAGLNEKTKITFVADSSGSLNNTWFGFEIIGAIAPPGFIRAPLYAWYDVNGAGTDPAPAGYAFGFQISLATDATAADVASATIGLWKMYGLDHMMMTSVNSQYGYFTNAVWGEVTPAANGTASPGFTFERLRESTNDPQVLWAELLTAPITKLDTETYVLTPKFTLQTT